MQPHGPLTRPDNLPAGIVRIGEVLPDVIGQATIRQIGEMYRLRPFEVRQVLLAGQVPVWPTEDGWCVFWRQFGTALYNAHENARTGSPNPPGHGQPLLERAAR